MPEEDSKNTFTAVAAGAAISLMMLPMLYATANNFAEETHFVSKDKNCAAVIGTMFLLMFAGANCLRRHTDEKNDNSLINGISIVSGIVVSNMTTYLSMRKLQPDLEPNTILSTIATANFCLLFSAVNKGHILDR